MSEAESNQAEGTVQAPADVRGVERVTGPGGGDAGFLRRVRAQLTGASVAATPAAFVALALLRSHGVIAPVPYWFLGVLLFGAMITSLVVGALLPTDCRGWRMAIRVGVMMLSIGAVIYSTGWQLVLYVGFIFGAAEVIRVWGSAAAVPAMAWIFVVVDAAQLLVAAGVFPSRIGGRNAHWLATVSLLGVFLVVVVLRQFARARESVESELRSREASFRALVHHANDIILVIDSDAMVRYASPAFQRVLGLDDRWWRSRSISDLVHPDDLEPTVNTVPQAISEPGAVTSTELRLRSSREEWLSFEANISNHFDDPDIQGVIVNLHDVTERKAAEREAWEAHQHFSSSFEEAPIGMALVDLEGRILRANTAYARILGRELASLVGTNVSELIHPEDQAQGLASLEELTASTEGSIGSELRYLRPDGSEVWVSATAKCVRGADGCPIHYLGQFVDISAERAMRARVEYAAIHDSLTGLPNRALFMDRLSMALSRAQRGDRRVGLVFIDLDQFKRVNDSLGHMVGDRLLVAVGERLRQSIRPGDTVARLGGDEFIVLCEDVTDLAEASGIAHRLMGCFQEPVDLDGGFVFVAASMGVAVSDLDASPSSLISQADTAMYTAKDTGRGRVETFSEESHTLALNAFRTTNELHRALDRGEFCVHYQPIVRLATERLVGLEALVRWRHPTRGELVPAQFLDLAEESGLIVPLGRWVLGEACGQVAAWESRRGGPQLRPLMLNVNVSARQLLDAAFVSDVLSVLERTGLEPRALCLEITEHTLVTDMESTVGVLATLRDHGVRLSLDDFGTGFSFLSHLKRFEIDSLKVDRSFVDGLGSDPDDVAIVQAVITLAHSFSLEAVAEGVETPIELDELRRLGCDMVQGYLLGVPLPAEDLGPVLGEALGAWRLVSERHLA